MNWDCTGALNLENTSADASVMAPPIPMKDWKVLLGLTNTAISVSRGWAAVVNCNFSVSVNRNEVFAAVHTTRIPLLGRLVVKPSPCEASVTRPQVPSESKREKSGTLNI